MRLLEACGIYHGPTFYMTDNELIRQWRAGDADSFGQLYSKYNKELTRYINYMDPECPEDMAHDIWVKIWENPDRYREGNFASWLFRVAYGAVIDKYRTRPKPITWLPDYESEPDLFDHIDLDVLSSRQKAVVAYRLQGLSFQEISAKMGVPVGTLMPAYTTSVIKIRRDLMARGIINKVPHADLNSRYLFGRHSVKR